MPAWTSTALSGRSMLAQEPVFPSPMKIRVERRASSLRVRSMGVILERSIQSHSHRELSLSPLTASVANPAEISAFQKASEKPKMRSAASSHRTT